jgi:hypothetical protein
MPGTSLLAARNLRGGSRCQKSWIAPERTLVRGLGSKSGQILEFDLSRLLGRLAKHPLLAVVHEPAARGSTQPPTVALFVYQPKLVDLSEKILLQKLSIDELLLQFAVFLFRLCKMHRFTSSAYPGRARAL